jgi:putative methionine-R-sulfoxide reductase with GAF domain
VKEPNSFGDPEILKDLESALAAAEESHLNQLLGEACLATGATGAAIALVRGEEIVCHATTGPHAPDIGVCLDPRTGLSGSCIQTRQLQQCNDTQTDPRVDPEACRSLGVRSIVALPLMDGDKLFGVFEIFSSRPNAFSQCDLDTLRALTNRIVESRRQNWDATASVPSKESGSFLHKLEDVVPQDKSHSSESNSGLPPRERISRRTDLRLTALGVLVIAAAMLVGTLEGWRLGWQKATLALRASSLRHRTSAPFKAGQIGRTVVPADELQPSSAGMDECGLPAAASTQTRPPTGGLMVCQGGRVIFRLLASAPLPTRDLRTAQHSPALPADAKRK